MSNVRLSGLMLLITGALALSAAAYESPAIFGPPGAAAPAGRSAPFAVFGLQGTLAAAPEPIALPDVQEILRGYDSQAAEAQRKLEAELRSVRERTLKQLQARQDDYTRAAKLDEAVAVRDLIRGLKANWNVGAGSVAALPDPGSLSTYYDKIGQSFLFDVTGANQGSVWGTDIYTCDSTLAAAAVHAGVLKSGQRGVVRVTILDGKSSYAGCNLNGVTSNSWGSYPASYRVEAASTVRITLGLNAAAIEEAPSSLTTYRGQINTVKYFHVTGAESGWVWGADVYTDDSTLGAAAVHAGVLKVGERGVVKVTILAGQDSYSGGSRNGVTSHPYGWWGGSYRVEAAGVIAR